MFRGPSTSNCHAREVQIRGQWYEKTGYPLVTVSDRFKATSKTLVRAQSADAGPSVKRPFPKPAIFPKRRSSHSWKESM